MEGIKQQPVIQCKSCRKRTHKQEEIQKQKRFRDGMHHNFKTYHSGAVAEAGRQ